MKIVFVSNYFNHHQKSLSDALFRLTEGKYFFIETGKMREDRRQLGYGMENLPDYVLKSHGDENALKKSHDLIKSADAVITGSAPEDILRPRIRAGKLIFRFSERPLKNGTEWKKYLPRLLRWYIRNPVGKPIYLLCAGGFTAADYRRFGLFDNRAYKWSYFPDVKNYEHLPPKVIFSILWCGRLLEWKHPDDALEAAKRLREDGYDFQMNLIGIGAMEDTLKSRCVKYGLQDYVHFLGSMKPEEVRVYMEGSGIFLLTSDRQEGWGAVLNEAMNSGCAVVASDAVGSVPFLVNDGKNGLIYESGNVDMLCKKIEHLLKHPEEQERLGKNAYRTITEEWNAENAAERFVNLAEHILSGETSPNLYVSGPCSRAEIIKESWFKG